MRVSRAVGLVLLRILLIASAGCATRIYPPSNPPRPVAVYVCDYGVHSSLLLPSGRGWFVEYVYGDWAFAALNQTDPFHTLQALFHSPQAGLGRRFLRTAPGQTGPLPPNRPRHIESLIVDSNRVHDIVQTLDQRYRQQIDTLWFNDEPDYNFLFVKDSQHYSAFNNCNTLTGRELQAMGCTLSGNPLFSRFEVVPPGAPAMVSVQTPAPVTLDATPH
jgi:hypothetical protein